ncbi:hypothetical protein OG21DRAFT_1607776 [Imleria badia]|nr:hypothetical protein OG21DRAFT_1607776 [Imleria badia]
MDGNESVVFDKGEEVVEKMLWPCMDKMQDIVNVITVKEMRSSTKICGPTHSMMSWRSRKPRSWSLTAASLTLQLIRWLGIQVVCNMLVSIAGLRNSAVPQQASRDRHNRILFHAGGPRRVLEAATMGAPELRVASNRDNTVGPESGLRIWTAPSRR